MSAAYTAVHPYITRADSLDVVRIVIRRQRQESHELTIARNDCALYLRNAD